MDNIKTDFDENQESDIVRKKKKGVLATLFSEYCSNTSIHGIGYLGADDKSKIEKIWWIVVFVLSVSGCSFLIFRTWAKWNENPVIVSFNQEQTPIWQIPFPAVTVCPMNKVRQTIYNYTDSYQTYKNLSSKAYKKFLDISIICDLQWAFFDKYNKTTDDAAISTIMRVAPQLSDTIPYIIWRKKEYFEAEKLFMPVMTEEGLCFSFNMLNTKDMFTNESYTYKDLIIKGKANDGWTLENGYLENSTMETFPQRALKDGINAGISIRLHSMSYERDFVCGHPITGFKILLHNPAEVPRVSQYYILAPKKRHIVIAVSPKRTTTTKALRNIPPLSRNCYFSHEKNLRFYKIYTQDNCRVECIANLTNSNCGCVPFLLPRDNNTLICGYGNIWCISMVEKELLEFEMDSKMKTIKKQINETNFNLFKACNCLPSCNSLSYSAEVSQADFHFISSLKASNFFDGFNIGDALEVTQVDIFFKETQFLALRRSELYGQTDFLANCGGLLGLFLGFSFLSLIEIIYYVTVRAWFSFRYLKNKQ